MVSLAQHTHTGGVGKIFVNSLGNIQTTVGGSFIVLASGGGGGPRSRWQLMMDPYGGTGQ